jgi:hypothetical protein
MDVGEVVGCIILVFALLAPAVKLYFSLKRRGSHLYDDKEERYHQVGPIWTFKSPEL